MYIVFSAVMLWSWRIQLVSLIVVDPTRMLPSCCTGTTRKYYHNSHAHVHDAEHEDANEEPVAQLEQAVPAAAHVVGRGDPHRERTQGGHPAHRCVHAPVGVQVDVDGLVHGVAPSVEPDPGRRA